MWQIHAWTLVLSLHICALLWHGDMDWVLLGSCKEEIPSLLPFLLGLFHALTECKTLKLKEFIHSSAFFFCLVCVKPIPLPFSKWDTQCRCVDHFGSTESRIPKGLRYSTFCLLFTFLTLKVCYVSS